MTPSITAALITAGVLGMWFNSTRGIAIGAIAILTLVHGWLVAVVVIASALCFYLFRIRKP